jgi:hypothetical protein
MHNSYEPDKHTAWNQVVANYVTGDGEFSSHVCMVSRRSQSGSCWRRALGLALFASFCAVNVSAQTPPTATDGTRVPVLIELFTSEGCSDCPPADKLLEELDTRQPIPGAQAIVLSEHVTYWNHQGWTDPFSMTDIDERQKEYGERFRIDSIYTPQAVVDGAAQMVGNNGPEVTRAVEAAAKTPKEPLTIAEPHWDNGTAVFSVKGATDAKARLIGVLAADATTSQVAHGENAGRTLHHVAVVRVMKDFGSSAADGRPLRLSGGALAHGKDASGPVRLVVFAVDRKTGHVVAVAEQTINR